MSCYGTVSGDVDYFKIYLSQKGGLNHSVRIRFGDSSGTAFKDGNLDLELRDSNDWFVLGAYSIDDDEEIALNGRPAGTYYVKVYGRVGDPTPNVPNSNFYYKLELSLPEPVCGDVDGNGAVNSADVQTLSNHVFSGGNPPCLHQANVNSNSCAINSSDVVTLSNYVNLLTPLPPDACTCP